MSTYQSIATQRRGDVLWIRLNRPEKLNSLGPEMIAELDKVIDGLERDRQVAAVVITGSGRAFCAGADIKGSNGTTGPDALTSSLYGSISAMLRRLELLPMPVVAAINGIAVAGGLEVLLACDVVIAADTAVFGDAHARYGLLPGGGGSVRLARAVGAARAKYMMFTAKTFSAEEMRQWGLVNEVVAADRLDEAAAELTTLLAAKSPLALARMKHMVDTSLEQPLEVALASEQIICQLHDTSYDRNEGLSAFSEKREPVFKGA